MKYILPLAICLSCNVFFISQCNQYTSSYTACSACVPCATPMRPNLMRIGENFSDIIQFFTLLFGLVLSIFICCSNNLEVKFLPFHTNLNLLKQSPTKKTKTESYLYLMLLVILVIDASFDINIAMLLHLPIDVYPVFAKLSGFRKCISRIGPFAFCLQLLASAFCPETHFLCLFIIFIIVHYHNQKSTHMGYPIVDPTFK